ncbi:Cell adhesion molecule 1 [Orchesella cincta]|uniref:Cell adhesion molecule 1 n=1 Tax=Orchesella cincta TaxID=48709 RepID=A0A1D2MLW0_ORCCI|nr:Cell adhesion molecule 1 [Orchesella cincta]
MGICAGGGVSWLYSVKKSGTWSSQTVTRASKILPPRSIEIVNHAPDATITVKEKESIDLECVVRDARPAATIIWYKNDKVLRTGGTE